jgi:uncharacterized phage-associated protein
MSTPLFLSNNFILKALKEEIALSPMKLQKLIYFTYRDYLKKTNSPLFSELISAWKYGPVVESVYNHFKPFGSSSINKFYKNSAGDVSILSESSEGFGDIIRPIWGKYREYTGVELSKITHKEGTAWHKAWTKGKSYLNNEDIINEQAE